MATRAEWDIWATLTFAYPIGPKGAIRALNEFLDMIARRCGERVLAAYSVELGSKGRWHVHALVEWPEDTGVELSTVRNLWKHGNRRVEWYDEKGGAAWYLVKSGNWDMTYGRPNKRWKRFPPTTPVRSP